MAAPRADARVAKVLIAALMAFLAVSWWPAFGLPLGDSHEGRVLGQFSLHVANFWELGLVGSSFGRPGSHSPRFPTPTIRRC